MDVDPEGEPRIWTIGDINRRASLAVVKDFRGQVWTEGELARLDDRRGHRYLQLVERGGGRDGRDAHLGAFCSASKWQRLGRKLADAGVELRAGQRLKLLGCLEIGDRGGLTLTVDDVDVAALVGDRLRARRLLVQRLVDDDLFDANRRLRVPPLPLRVGVVASAGSDGHRDLLRQLESSGFAFAVTLRSVPVEGPSAPRAIQAALATFGPADVDVAVIVRGGGAKASLDVFDMPMVAKAIATANVAVWTGIGHTGDRAVADDVAHRCFPTPSAVGQALAAAALAAWEELGRAVARIARIVDARLIAAASHLAGHRRAIATLARSQLVVQEQVSARAAVELRRCAARGLDRRSAQLTVAAHAIRASGGAELRSAQRGLADLALDTAAAARRRSADAVGDLAAAAASVTAATAGALHRAEAPIGRSAALLTRRRVDAILAGQSDVLCTAGRRVDREVRRRLAGDTDRAASRRAVLEAYDPHRQLARGWTLTHTPGGRLLRSAGELGEGDELVTTFGDGSATSTVTGVTGHEHEEAAP
jgi:exodeoxyribonuclease VII large subunit